MDTESTHVGATAAALIGLRTARLDWVARGLLGVAPLPAHRSTQRLPGGPENQHPHLHSQGRVSPMSLRHHTVGLTGFEPAPP
jgi:hypothetical protein